MKWSWKLGEFGGIGLFMHGTFPLLLIFAALSTFMDGGNLLDAVSSVMFVLVLFVCVVLHEYGHAFAARRYGIKTQDITLLPIGGVARLERMPEKPSQELVVAAAGPAVNVAIAAILFVVMFFAQVTVPSFGWGWGNDSFLEQLLMVNVVLILFNLIPAFPMDGGRILRALLATRLDYATATKYAARLGQAIAIAFAIGGFFINPILIITAAFIFFGAQAEAQMAQQRSVLSGFTVGQAMQTNLRALNSYEWLTSAIDSAMSTAQQDFPIVENGRVVGILTRDTLLNAARQFGVYVPIAQVMRRDVTTLDTAQSLVSASEIMQANELSSLPVTQNGTLVGMLTLNGIHEFLSLQKVLRGQQKPVGQMRFL